MAGLFLALLGLLQAMPAYASVRTVSESGKPIYWPNPNVYFAGNPVTSGALSNTDIQTMLTAAFAAWQSAPGTRMQTHYSQTASNPASSDYDGINAVYFASHANRELPSNIVALTEVLYYVNSGQIAEADMVFNDNDFEFTKIPGDTGKPSTAPYSSKIYLQDVATHEAGHALGLDHSTVNLSTMFYMAYSGQYFLSDDDANIMSSIYPSGSANAGAISGTVKGTAGGIFGTQVSAINLSTGRVAAATLANPDGSFRLGNLPNASYTIFMEPFLTSTDTISSYYENLDHHFCGSGGNLNFKRGFYGTCYTQQASVVAITGGGSVNVNTISPSCSVMSGPGATTVGTPVEIPAKGAVHGVLTTGNSDYYVLRGVSGTIKAKAMSYSLFSPNDVSVRFLSSPLGTSLGTATSVADIDTNKPGGGFNYDSTAEYTTSGTQDLIVQVRMDSAVTSDNYPGGFTMKDANGFYLLSLSVGGDYGAATPVDMQACASVPNRLQSALSKQTPAPTVDTGGGCGTLGGPGAHGGGPGGGLTLLFTSAGLLQAYFLAKRSPRLRVLVRRKH